MSESATSKWNARYQFSGATIPPPAEVLSRGMRWLPEVDSGSSSDVPGSRVRNETEAGERTALDLACGRAGNAHCLALAGFIVSAWDISNVVTDQLKARRPQIIHDIQCRDVVRNPPEPLTFDVIVVTRFLDRALCSHLQAALKPEGVLFYQTFTAGLANADYLLKPDELPDLFDALDVLEYHDGIPLDDGKFEARLVARKP
ncbi:MAG: class I SAM-dependent methyltransferase [Granulosicoccus sp.]